MAKKQMQNVQVYTDMVYCPECGAIQSRKENFCSQCGATLHDAGKKSSKSDKADIDAKNGKSELAGEGVNGGMKKKVPFYKNKVFLFFIGFFLITLTIVSGILFLKMNESAQFKNDVLSSWGVARQKVLDENNKIKNMSKLDDFKVVAIDLKSSEDVISEEKDKINKIDTPSYYSEGKDDLVKGLDMFISYSRDLRAQADNPQGMTDQDVASIEKTAEQVKNQFIKVYAKLDFIDDKLPDDIYSVVDKFKDVRTEYEKQLASDEQQKAEAERSTQQAEESKAKAEAVVKSFTNAYIAGNQTDIKKYMTSAFQKEFNYADLSSDARLYSYPESFRVTTTKKMSDTQYDIYGRELQVNRDSGSKWTINRHFAVLYSASDNQWLIDRWDISTE